MFFEYNGTKLYYELKGNLDGKETVAFFNGVMASTSSWDNCVPTLEKAGYRVLCHDFKGQMRSDKPVPEGGIYSFAEHATEAKALFQHLGITSAHVVGTSYGGEVGMKMASMYPESVKTLTIIDSVSELDEVCKNFVVGWKIFCDCDGESFFNGMAPSIYGADFFANNKEFLQARAKAMNNVDRSYFDGQKILYDTFANNVTMTDELSKITCPTLVICGEQDILKPPKFSQIIHKNIKNSEYITFPNCGHVTIFEKPNELNTALLGFLTKNKD